MIVAPGKSARFGKVHKSAYEMKNGWSRNAISGEKWVVSSCAFSILSSAPSPPRVACRQAIARGANMRYIFDARPSCWLRRLAAVASGSRAARAEPIRTMVILSATVAFFELLPGSGAITAAVRRSRRHASHTLHSTAECVARSQTHRRAAHTTQPHHTKQKRAPHARAASHS